MTVQRSPVRIRLSLRPGQNVLLGVSAVLLAASALMVWHYIPMLPARIPTHWSGASAPDGYGPPSTLWGLWALMLGMWVVFGLIAWQAPGGRVPLNGMPPVTPQNAERVLGELRTAFLMLQAMVMILFSGLVAMTIVYSLGGPNLIALSLLSVVLLPLGTGYMLYRLSYAAQR